MFKAIQTLNALSREVSPFTNSVSSDSSRASPEAFDFTPLISATDEIVISDLQRDLTVLKISMTTPAEESLIELSEKAASLAKRLDDIGRSDDAQRIDEASFWLKSATFIDCPQGMPSLYKSIRDRLETIILQLEEVKPSVVEHFSF